MTIFQSQHNFDVSLGVNQVKCNILKTFSRLQYFGIHLVAFIDYVDC